MTFPCKECCNLESGSIVSRSENKMRFEIVNKGNKKIKVCKVDGCLINSTSKRCDYLFIFANRAILVELKGRDRNHALYQIIETAETLDSKSFSGNVEAFIVTSRVPRADTKYQTNMAKLKKRFTKAKCGVPIQKNLCISVPI